MPIAVSIAKDLQDLAWRAEAAGRKLEAMGAADLPNWLLRSDDGPGDALRDFSSCLGTVEDWIVGQGTAPTESNLPGR